MIMEASHGAERDLVLPSRFEAGVERPVAFAISKQPEELQVLQLSGYWVPAGEARRLFPEAHRFSRSEIIDFRGRLG
jgi:hypothetical protein